MALDPKLKRAIDKHNKEVAQYNAKSQDKAERRYNRPSRTYSRTRLDGLSGSARPVRIVNIYNPVYGDSVTVHGTDNQVAVGNEGDVQQLTGAGEQDISTQPVEPATAQLAAQDLLHQLRIGGIEVDDPELAEQLQADAEEIQAEASTEDPDQGTLKRIATAIAEKLTSISVAGVGGFVAQLLASAFVPPAS